MTQEIIRGAFHNARRCTVTDSDHFIAVIETKSDRGWDFCASRAEHYVGAFDTESEAREAIFSRLRSLGHVEATIIDTTT